MPELKTKLAPPTGDIIKQVWILGGEPLLQNTNLLLILLEEIKYESNKEIVLFTRLEFDEIPEDIVETCDYIKCGKYDERYLIDDYESFGIKLATSNQYVIKVSELEW
jgi:organic radical activating enzyme